MGIPTETLPHIFEMFVQAEHRTDRAQGGLGIGLSLVNTLVRMHGGAIEVRSGGSGTGSEFLVRLPALPTASASDTVVNQARPAESGGALNRLRILVVDDNQDAAESLARVLTRVYKQEVKVVHDGHSALEAALEFQSGDDPARHRDAGHGRLRDRPQTARTTGVRAGFGSWR